MNQQIKRILLGIMMISFIVSTGIGMVRISREYHHRTIQIAVRYTDVLQIAKETGESLESVLKDLKQLGATTLMVRENTVQPSQEGHFFSDVEQGRVALLSDTQKTYIVSENEETIDRIHKHLTMKNVPVERIQKNARAMVALDHKDTASLTTVGTGFIQEDLELAAQIGFVISPEIRNWENPTEESISWMVEEIKKIPHLNSIYFEDKVIPGYDQSEMVDLVKAYGLGFIEFYSPAQKGFKTLADTTKSPEGFYQVTRMFSDEKVENISTPNTVARYELALTERGIRNFTFILPSTDNKEKDLETYKENISVFKSHAEAGGYTIAHENQFYAYDETNAILLWIVGLGTIGVMILLMDSLNRSKAGYIIGMIVFIGYTIGIVVAKDLSIQGMALLSSILFPSYGIITKVKDEPKKSLKDTIKTFLNIVGITFVGAMSIVGLLSDPQYMLGINGFRGVKLAHLVPLILVGGIFIYQYRDKLKTEFKELLQAKWSYGWLFIILLTICMGAVVLVYVMRTGNGEISDFEKILRQGLDQLLGVRPRTKEFLIGHPLMIGLLYFGYKGMYWPVLILGVIGQISLINTYAHIHTPLMVSLIRSAYGIGIGIVIGIMLIQVVKFIFKVINKWIIKQK